jgi:hypothetical protein
MGKKVKPFNPTNKTVANHYKELLALDDGPIIGTLLGNDFGLKGGAFPVFKIENRNVWLLLDHQTVEGMRIEPYSKMDRPDGAAVRFPWWEVYLQSQESIRWGIDPASILGRKGYWETFRSQFPQYKNDTGAKP